MYKDAAVVEGVSTLRLEEQGTQILFFCGYGKDPECKMETSSDGGGLGCLMSGTASVNQRGTVDLKCARNPRKFPQTLGSRTGCELCSPSAGAHAARLAETRNSSEVVHDLGALRNTDLQRKVDLQGQLLAAQRSRVTFVRRQEHRKASNILL